IKVSCIQVLSQLALSQNQVQANKDIGTFLITIVNGLPDVDSGPSGASPAVQSPSAADVGLHPEVVIEALNAVYDVYADAEFDYDEEVFVKFGFLKYLKSFAPRVRSMVCCSIPYIYFLSL